MKYELTEEQSAILINRGINKTIEPYTSIDLPIFTIMDILDLLPKKILKEDKYYYLSIHVSSILFPFWTVNYYNNGYPITHSAVSNELIDALYSLVVWCVDNNYLDNS